MQEIKPGIWFVEGENRGRYPYAHSLYIEGDMKTLIDTGAGRELEQLFGKTEQVLLTHYHRDHVTHNPAFENARFAIHQLDAPGVESLEGFYRLSGLDQVDVEAYWKMVRQAGFIPTSIHSYLEDGDYLDTGRYRLQTLHLPGHTGGHCGFLIEEYGLLFAADLDITSFGPWYGNTTSDPDQFRSSIERVRSLKPEILVTGHHRPVTKKIDLILENYGKILDQRDDRIITALKEKPMTLKTLAAENIIYKAHHGQEVLIFFEKVMIEKHLKSLNKRGIVVNNQGVYYLRR